MKKLRDRFDVLLDAAKDGDSHKQLELARCFYEGTLVEKSLDAARYWAFCSASNGNAEAQSFYNKISYPDAKSPAPTT